MFIGVIHDNSDTAYLKQIGVGLLGIDVDLCHVTNPVPIEQFMAKDIIEPRYPMYLTCLFALPLEEIDSMMLILGTEFFGSLDNELAARRAKQQIISRASVIEACRDGALCDYFARFRDPADIYWNFLAFLSVQYDVIGNVTIDTFPINDKEMSLIYYNKTRIGSAYVNGFVEGNRARVEEARAKDPAMKNVISLKPKK